MIGDPVHRVLEVAELRRTTATFRYSQSRSSDVGTWRVTLGGEGEPGAIFGVNTDLEPACESILRLIMEGHR